MKGKGRGVFATSSIKKGATVCEYTGEQISFSEARIREQRYSKTKSTGCFMYYFKYEGNKLW